MCPGQEKANLDPDAPGPVGTGAGVREDEELGAPEVVRLSLGAGAGFAVAEMGLGGAFSTFDPPSLPAT